MRGKERERERETKRGSAFVREEERKRETAEGSKSRPVVKEAHFYGTYTQVSALYNASSLSLSPHEARARRKARRFLSGDREEERERERLICLSSLSLSLTLAPASYRANLFYISLPFLDLSQYLAAVWHLFSLLLRGRCRRHRRRRLYIASRPLSLA